jgi:hypothetical protein
MSEYHFQVGDLVRVRWDAPRVRSYQGQRGEVVRVLESKVTVRFLEQPRTEDSVLRFIRLTLKSGELLKEP